MPEQIISPGLFQNETDQSQVTKGPIIVGAAIVGPTVHGNPYVPTYVGTYSEYVSIFGETFKSGSYYYEYFTSLAAKDYFQNGGKTLLVTRVVSGSSNANTYSSASLSSFASTSSASLVLETLSWGDQMNNSSSMSNGALSSGTKDNVRWEVTNVNTGSGVFTIVIRRGDDNQSTKNILETWANLSLDPSLPNYVSRVIGDIKPFYTADIDGTAYISENGSYTNSSRYVRVKSITTPNVDSIDNNGTFKKSQYSGSLPALGSGSLGGAFNGGVADTNLAKLMNENITTSNVQGFTSADYIPAFALLANQDEYQFNILIAPGIGLSNSAASTFISTCEGREDAIAITDVDVFGKSVNEVVSSGAGQNSSYAATYYPWLQIYSSNLGKAVWCPPSVVMAGVYAFNDSVGAEWFAPAGLNRGGIPSVIKPERKLQQSDRDILYSGNVNPIATFPGEGVVAWGQKTLQKKATALDRINVRRLLINLKGFIGNVGRNLTFEGNTAATRNKFLAQTNPYIEMVIQKNGLYAAKVVMDDSNNTGDIIDRNQLVGQIYIQPTKTAEFIILNYNIQPTGTTFS